MIAETVSDAACSTLHEALRIKIAMQFRSVIFAFVMLIALAIMWSNDDSNKRGDRHRVHDV